MRAFDEVLREDIAFYEGRHDDLIYLARNFYRLLTSLLDDPRWPTLLRPLISCAIAYFLLPADIISEELHGPYGYVDDIWLCAYVADTVRHELNEEAILVENWVGEAPLIPLIREVLEKEQGLIADGRDKIYGIRVAAIIGDPSQDIARRKNRLSWYV